MLLLKKLSTEAMNGTKIGGKTYTYGLKEDAVGIPTENKNVDPEVYKAAIKLEEEIKSGKIVVPADEAAFKEFSK